MFFSYLSLEDEMQISRMPIPADDCADSEMSVDTNPSDTKSDLETTTKINGDGLQKLNGTAVDDAKEASEPSEVKVKDEIIEMKDEIIEVKKEKLEADEVEEKEDTGAEAKEVESEKKIESIPESTDEPVKNGTSEPPEEHESENNIDVVSDKNSDKNENITIDNDKPKDEEEVKPMEIDIPEDKSIVNVIIKKEIEEPKVEENAETQEEKLNNGDINHSNEVVKNEEKEVSPVNGDAKPVDVEKSIESEKVSQKVPEEEDILSEISVDILSPKQVFIAF